MARISACCAKDATGACGSGATGKASCVTRTAESQSSRCRTTTCWRYSRTARTMCWSARRAFCEDRDGSIWIGTDAGLSRWRGGRFQNFNTQDGLAYGSIRALMLGRDGDLWIATDGGLSRFRDGTFVIDPLLDPLRGEKIW